MERDAKEIRENERPRANCIMGGKKRFSTKGLLAVFLREGKLSYMSAYRLFLHKVLDRLKLSN